MEECCSLALVFEVELNVLGDYYSYVYHMHSTMDNISQFNPPMADMINDTVLCLQQGIDVISAELKCWESQLSFLIHEFGTPLSDHTMVQQDLLQFTKKMWVGRKFYLSIVKYPIDGSMTKD
jgi:hypothetical protein